MKKLIITLCLIALCPIASLATSQDDSELWFLIAQPRSGGFAATGGNSTNDSGGYRIHTFTSSGNFVVASGGSVDYLIVAGGGGGGGGWQGGGGGAGGYLTGSATLSATTYGITVGAGGNGCTGTVASNGYNSVFNSLTSIGGGRGASETPDGLPQIGGSGGGGGWKDVSYKPGAAGTSGQGYAGGDGFAIDGDNIGGGGGGGSSGAGTTATAGVMQPAGGVGTSSSISGSPVTYAAGGKGANRKYNANGANASANTGGGGGGGGKTLGSSTGGNGGSGIVIIRYAH